MQARYLLNSQLENYKKILPENTLINMLSFAEKNKHLKDDRKSSLNATLSRLSATTEEGFEYTLTEKEKREIIQFILNPAQTQYSIFMRGIFDNINPLKKVPGFEKLYTFLEKNSAILNTQSVGKTTEQHLKDILKALD